MVVASWLFLFCLRGLLFLLVQSQQIKNKIRDIMMIRVPATPDTRLKPAGQPPGLLNLKPLDYLLFEGLQRIWMYLCGTVYMTTNNTKHLSQILTILRIQIHLHPPNSAKK